MTVKIRKPRVLKAKPRCGGTMTEATFWAFIRSALRQKSRWWKPISAAKANAKRPYKGTKARQKFEYQCNHCKKWFPEKEIDVDHIIGAGKLRCAADLPGFVERLFCEVSGLQVLCVDCHDKKTENENEKS
jgi:5-methylcytosine-specific restriction endonuclease McrA